MPIGGGVCPLAEGGPPGIAPLPLNERADAGGLALGGVRAPDGAFELLDIGGPNPPFPIIFMAPPPPIPIASN